MSQSDARASSLAKVSLVQCIYLSTNVKILQPLVGQDDARVAGVRVDQLPSHLTVPQGLSSIDVPNQIHQK